MSNEVPVISAWIYGTCVNDAGLIAAFESRGLDVTGQVWEYRAPEGTPEPWLVYQRQPDSGRDVVTLEGVRVYNTSRYWIRVVAKGEGWQHEDIANRIDALFGRVTNVEVADPPGAIYSCVRVDAFDLPEDVGGVQYRHLGGVHEIAAVAA